MKHKGKKHIQIGCGSREKYALNLSVFSIFLVAMIVSSQFFIAGRTKATIWHPEIEVNTDIGQEFDYGSRMAVGENGEVHIVWDEQSSKDIDIHYRLFDGSVWHPEVDVDEDHGTGGGVGNIDVEGNDVYVVWDVNWIIGRELDYDIRLRHYDGTTWLPEEEISEDAGIGGGIRLHPELAVEKDNIHVVWQDDRDRGWDIYYRHFNGNVWEPEEGISVDNSSGAQTLPDIAVESGKVYVVWENLGLDSDFDIYFSYFDGSIWSPVEEISVDSGFEDQVEPSIAVENGNVHVVWSEAHQHIFYRKYNGSSWESPVQLDSGLDIFSCASPSIAVDGGKVHVAWYAHDLDVMMDIYYRKFDGLAWQPVEKVTDTQDGFTENTAPDIAAREGKVHIAFDRFVLVPDPYSHELLDADVYYVMGEEDPAQDAISSTADCDPDTLNLRSRGKWITCYIELPRGYDPREIDATTILLNDVLSPELDPEYGFVRSEASYIMDHDADGIEERMVKFDRSEVQELLSPGELVSLTITGRLFDGTKFEGTDEIRVINPPQLFSWKFREENPRISREVDFPFLTAFL